MGLRLQSGNACGSFVSKLWIDGIPDPGIELNRLGEVLYRKVHKYLTIKRRYSIG